MSEDPQRSTAPAHPHPWALQIARIAGVPIRLHVTFWLIILFAWWGASAAGLDPVMQVAIVLGVFGCIVLHELGHVLTARRFGIGTRDITLYAIGGVSSLESMGRPRQELFISIAGPLVSLAIAGVLWAALLATGRTLDAGTVERLRTGSAGYLEYLLVGNLLLAVFNLLPAFPMDGGRTLRAALALRMGKSRATRIAARVGQGFAVMMGLLGLLAPNLLLVVIAIFIFLGARAEEGMQEIVSATAGHAVRDAMITRFEVLVPEDSLSEAFEHLIRTDQQDFPVMEDGRVRGVLVRGALLGALGEGRLDTRVSDVMTEPRAALAPGQPLRDALEGLQERTAGPLLVLDQGRLVGLVTRENLMEFLAVARHA